MGMAQRHVRRNQAASRGCRPLSNSSITPASTSNAGAIRSFGTHAYPSSSPACAVRAALY